ncbi:hypothetical protein AAG906_017667 [Vitis piasezkii]
MEEAQRLRSKNSRFGGSEKREQDFKRQKVTHPQQQPRKQEQYSGATDSAKGPRRCYECGEMNPRIQGRQPQGEGNFRQGKPGGRPEQAQQGRFYAIGSQNEESNALVEGMILCFSTWAHVLFDPGATHSFISASFASMLDIEFVPLHCSLCVETPMGGKVETKWGEGKKMTTIDCIPVVCEFADVFPKELPCLPPHREMDFSIELYPGTDPISIAPYRMAPVELKELNIQLQELQTKGRKAQCVLSGLVVYEWKMYDYIMNSILALMYMIRCMFCTLVAQPTILQKVIEAQRKDTKLEGIRSRIRAGDAVEGWNIHSNGGIHFLNKLCEAHHSRFTVHHGETKMYHDLRRQYWWQGMKRDISQFVSKCLTCQQVKVEHQKPGGLLQPLSIAEWKWDHVTMDFVTGCQ